MYVHVNTGRSVVDKVPADLFGVAVLELTAVRTKGYNYARLFLGIRLSDCYLQGLIDPT